MKELFTRLTFNSNNWEYPSGHHWKKSNQGKSNIPYENQYGFGHEEWLFNLRYNVDSWQYGYIRGLKSAKTLLDKVHLYTINIENGQREIYYVGILNKVEPLDSRWNLKFPRAAKAFSKYEPSVIDELENVNAVADILKRDEFIPTVRFRISDMEQFPEPILLSGFPLSRYKRFQPYKITPEISRLLATGKAVSALDHFKFVAGKANQTSRYKKYMTGGSKTVIKKHTEIVDKLEKFLSPEYSLAKNNISIEMTKFKGCIADIVTKERDKSMSIYEVKTKIELRRNIREAIGQLLDYTSFSDSTTINKLVIVAPCKLDKDGKAFISSLEKLVKIPIEFLEFDETIKEFFIVHKS
jgi:hypothetical protein